MRPRAMPAFLLAVLILSATVSAQAATGCIDRAGIGGTGAPAHEGGIGGTGSPAREGGIGGTGAPTSHSDRGESAAVAASGIGGTGSPASGIGGTGAPLARSGVGGTGAPASDGGMGGTGAPLNADGIGGTGIVGTITGFASVCVNGVEVHFDAETPVDENGAPATGADLSVGQVVAISATRSRRGLEARAISIVNAYEGPITDLSADGATISVMGRPVRMALDAQRPRSLTVGDQVRVSGLRAANGEILATSVKAAPLLRESSVSGPITSDGSVSGIAIRSAAMVSTGAQAVLVRGMWAGKSLDASAIRPSPVTETLRGARHAIVEGLVHRAGQGRLQLDGLSIDTDSATGVSGGLMADLAIGRRVRVTASLTAEKHFRADRIQIVDYHERSRDSDSRRGPGGASGAAADMSSDSTSDSTRGAIETRLDSSDGERARSETRSESASDELRTRSEVRADSEGRDSARSETESRSRLEDGGEVRERIRSESRGERSDTERRVETFDSNGRRIDRTELRTRDGAQRDERSRRGPSLDSSGRLERIERIETPEKVEKVERIETPEKVEKVERIETPEKVEKVERIETPEKVERIEAPEKVERIETPEKIERNEGTSGIERPERIDNSGKG